MRMENKVKKYLNTELDNPIKRGVVHGENQR